MDSRIRLAKQCFQGDSTFHLKELLDSPTFDALRNHNSTATTTTAVTAQHDKRKLAIREIHEIQVHTAHTAYKSFHAVVESLKAEKPNEELWEGKIGSAALACKDVMSSALDTMGVEARRIIVTEEEEEEEEAEGDSALDNAQYFCFCLNEYVLFVRKVNEALELVYESRGKGLQRLWTALETAGRTVAEAEAAALKWVAGQDAFKDVEVGTGEREVVVGQREVLEGEEGNGDEEEAVAGKIMY